MPSKTNTLAILVIFWSMSAIAADPAAPKVNYQEHVAPIFQARCNSCHNADKQKGGLTLDNYSAAMQGGGSGKVVEPGDPSSSTLWGLVTHAAQPNMPPKSPKLPDAELDVIKRWIEAGAPESSGSAVAIKAKPKFNFKLDPSAMGKPQGPPAMPENLSTDPVVVSAKPNAITAMAASPWAPLVAVSGHKQVLVYRTDTLRLAAVFPFPEGTVHTLKFSRNGALLLAGGGRGGQSGRVVVWDVKTGNRAFEIGKEYDAVLAADISPDHGQVALGGPGKVVKVYGTADGELLYEIKKHTEWVTALEFSPDGVLLASGDRNNGLFVWEASTGREFFDLRGHTLAITDVSWRLDSNVVASASEDGTIRLWEMENGTPIKNWAAHGGGTLAVRFAKDGRIASAGRDKVAKLWDPNGAPLKGFEPFADLALRVALTHDEAALAAGDWLGEIRVWEVKEGRRLGNLSANPAPLSARLGQAATLAASSAAEAQAASAGLAALPAAAANQTAALTAASQALAAAQQDAAKRAGESAAAEGVYAQQDAAERAAQDDHRAAVAAQQRATAAQAELDRLAAVAVADSQAAAAVSAQTKAPRDAEIAVKAAAAQAVAANQANAARPQTLAVVEAAKAHEIKAAAATVAKGVALKTLTDARALAVAAAAVVPVRQAEATAATAAKAAADKAVADNTPAVQAVVAKAAALKADADALAAEAQAAAARAPTATAMP